jgi:hypothetical protein
VALVAQAAAAQVVLEQAHQETELLEVLTQAAAAVALAQMATQVLTE